MAAAPRRKRPAQKNGKNAKDKAIKVSTATSEPATGIPNVPPISNRHISKGNEQKPKLQGTITSHDIERLARDVSKCTTNIPNYENPRCEPASLTNGANANEKSGLSKSQRKRQRKHDREQRPSGCQQQPKSHQNQKNTQAPTKKQATQHQPWKPIAAWKQLPFELTLVILKWTLVSPAPSMPLPVGLEWRAEPSLRKYKVRGKNVFPDVNMVWISKTLYRDCLRTYYSQNTWLLSMSDYRNYRETIRQWPHDCVPTARDCVQYLHIRKDLWEEHWWDFFRRLASFNSLRELTFNIRERNESVSYNFRSGVTIDAPDEFKLQLEAATKFTNIRLSNYKCAVCDSGQEHQCKDKCLRVTIHGDSKQEVDDFAEEMWCTRRDATYRPDLERN